MAPFSHTGGLLTSTACNPQNFLQTLSLVQPYSATSSGSEISGLATPFRTFTSGMMMFYNGDKDWTARDKVYNVAKAHRKISYVTLIFANAVVTGGTWTYLKKIGFDPWGPIALVEITFFGFLWMIHEFILRRYNR